jgi:hypothetical protein
MAYLGAINFTGQFRAYSNLSGNFRLAGTPVQGFAIQPGDAGIRQTCYYMRDQVNQGQRDALVKSTHAAIIANSNSQSQDDIARALTQWVVRNIQYTHDDAMSMTEKGLQWIDIHQCPSHFQKCEAVEMLNTPHNILTDPKGDCDDLCMLLGCFLALSGMDSKFVTIAADPSDPTQFSHVYLIANVNGTWIPIDPVNKSQPYGWELPNPYRREIMC